MAPSSTQSIRQDCPSIYTAPSTQPIRQGCPSVYTAPSTTLHSPDFPQLLLWLNTYHSEMQAFPRGKSRESTEEAQPPLLPLPHPAAPTFSTVPRLTCCCSVRFQWCWWQTCPYGRPVLEQKGCKKDVLPAILGACNTQRNFSASPAHSTTQWFSRERWGHLFQPAALEVRMLCSCLAHYFHRFSGKTETWKLFINA